MNYNIKTHKEYIKIFINNFGIKSILFSHCTSILYNELLIKKPSIKIFFDKWKKIYKKLYGEKITECLNNEIYKYYGANINSEKYIEFLFSIHTYYAIIIKLITIELLYNASNESYLTKILRLSLNDLKSHLNLLESGILFNKYGIENFPDDKIFIWYQYIDHIEDLIKPIIRTILKNINIINILIKDYIDLFGLLYQNIISRQIRHILGEHFTPIWLIELILNEIGYNGDLNKRLLEPCCGTFTFGIISLNRILNNIKLTTYEHKNILNNILNNIIGLEINPLSIIAAKANFIIFLRELLKNNNSKVFIPIYPYDFIEISSNNLIIKSLGKFDYIVGNPPWINWDSLKESMRDKIKKIYKNYNLIRGKITIGAIKTDISILFTYIAIDKFLKDNGILGFVITQSVFKSRAAEGFRLFKLPDNTPLKVLKVHDLTFVKPFETALNRTAIILLKKGDETTYPIPYIIWRQKAKLNKKNLSFLNLKEIKTKMEIKKYHAIPLSYKESPWIIGPINVIKELKKLTKSPSAYKPRLGINTGGANKIFWIKILRKISNNKIVITNLSGDDEEYIIDINLVYPLIRARDIRRWHIKFSNIYIIVPHNYKTGISAIPETDLKEKYPKTYEYFNNNKIKQILTSRRALKYRWGGSIKWWYSLFEIGQYTFSPYKVIYKGQVATDIVATVIGKINDKFLGETMVMIDQTAHLISTYNEDEAHYICAILNSNPVRLLYKCLFYKHPSTFFIKNIGIPKYNPKNKLHKKLAYISKKAHKISIIGDYNKLQKLENELSLLVNKLFSINLDNKYLMTVFKDL